MKPKLIITAHDYGVYKSVTDGILWCLDHPNNIITEVSLTPNFADSIRAAELIKSKNISISLNTNFTSEKPLSRNVPSLTNSEGHFLEADVKTWNFSNLDKYKDIDIRKELDAQYDFFIEQIGKKPSAILSKKNEFSDPKLLEIFVEKAKRENTALRSPMWMWKTNYAAQSYLNQEKVKHPKKVFVGLKDCWHNRFGYDLLSEDLDKLIEDIKSAEGTNELLLFPGFVDQELMTKSSLNWPRGQAIEIIKSKKITDRIRNEFELISFADL